MAWGDISGRARTSPRNPQAFGVCDRCGRWENRVTGLYWQYEYYGAELQNTRWLVCSSCLDLAQPQLKPIILPPDPVPVKDPRTENLYQDYGLQGFTEYVIQPLTPNAVISPSQIFSTIASYSNVSTPPILGDLSNAVQTANTSQVALYPNTNRSWLLIYNPSQTPLGVDENNAVFGQQSTIIIGPGEALFWATVQNGIPCYTGGLFVTGYIPGVPFNIWEYPPQIYLTSDSGTVLDSEQSPNPILIGG